MHIVQLIKDVNQVDIIDENFAIERSYSGKYSDLSNEGEMELVSQMDIKYWKDVVAENFQEKSPWLYKIITDAGRPLFLNILGIPQNGVYLDVGSGWGQVCIPLGRIGTSVALDLTFNRLNILKSIASQENVPLQYVQGNFLTFPFVEKSFDIIIFNGSLEWIGVGRDKDSTIREVQIKALKKANKMLKADGIIYVGIENSIGLKYILGAVDDHTGIVHNTFLDEKMAFENFKKITGTDQILSKTWSLEEYKEIFNEAELQVDKIYGCFPDYKLIRKMVDLRIINEELLKGMPVSEHLGTNGELFQKNKELDAIYKLLAKNKVAETFCPSYGFILRKRG